MLSEYLGIEANGIRMGVGLIMNSASRLDTGSMICSCGSAAGSPSENPANTLQSTRSPTLQTASASFDWIIIIRHTAPLLPTADINSGPRRRRVVACRCRERLPKPLCKRGWVAHNPKVIGIVLNPDRREAEEATIPRLPTGSTSIPARESSSCPDRHPAFKENSFPFSSPIQVERPCARTARPTGISLYARLRLRPLGCRRQWGRRGSRVASAWSGKRTDVLTVVHLLVSDIEGLSKFNGKPNRYVHETAVTLASLARETDITGGTAASHARGNFHENWQTTAS